MWTRTSTYKYNSYFSENASRNDNLEQQAQALYRSWFVDFEPFKGGKFVDSELGKIPKNWKIVPFNEILSISNKKTEFNNIPEYSITNTGIYPRETKFNKQLSSSSSDNKLIKCNDLVFGMSREILNWGLMEEEIGGVSPAYTVYNIDNRIVNPVFLKLFIRSRIELFRDLIRPAAREGQSVDKQVLMAKYIFIPTSDVLDKFWNIYNIMVESDKIVSKESANLIKIRDSLLPKLMSGELKVSE